MKAIVYIFCIFGLISATLSAPVDQKHSHDVEATNQTVHSVENHTDHHNTTTNEVSLHSCHGEHLPPIDCANGTNSSDLFWFDTGRNVCNKYEDGKCPVAGSKNLFASMDDCLKCIVDNNNIQADESVAATKVSDSTTASTPSTLAPSPTTTPSTLAPLPSTTPSTLAPSSSTPSPSSLAPSSTTTTLAPTTAAASSSPDPTASSVMVEKTTTTAAASTT